MRYDRLCDHLLGICERKRTGLSEPGSRSYDSRPFTYGPQECVGRTPLKPIVCTTVKLQLCEPAEPNFDHQIGHENTIELGEPRQTRIIPKSFNIDKAANTIG